MTPLLARMFMAAAVVVLSGTMLAQSGDRLADLTGIGRVWTASFLVGLATSLPELSTDFAAVHYGWPNLAIGDLFGSSLANMMILALVTMIPARAVSLRRAVATNLLAGGFAVMLNIVGVGFVISGGSWPVAVARLAPLLMLIIYAVGTFVIFRLGESHGTSISMGERAKDTPSPGVLSSVAIFALAAALILIAGPRLAVSAGEFSGRSGLSATLIGTVVLGITTALPELATAVAAARIGASDFAVAALFGSCAGNSSILFAIGVVYGSRQLFAGIDRIQALSGIGATLMMLLGLWITTMEVRRHSRMAILATSCAMAGCYVLLVFLIKTYAA
jgi:cation:H+ antiporter